MIALALAALQAALAASPDPFAFFNPSVTLSAEDRRQIDRGEPVARVVPSKDREIAVFAAVRVDVDGDRLVAWLRDIAELKKSPYVLAIGRFSNPPVIEDLAALALDDDELSDLRGCRPGRCALKLSTAEMMDLQRAALEAGRDWKPALQQAFRRTVLQRVTGYLADGHRALPPYENHESQVQPAATFAVLLDHSVFLIQRAPRFAEHLSTFPQARLPDVESFLYWSKERLANKAIISVTHVNILRHHEAELPDALVGSKQIFATHYLHASLGITALLQGTPGTHNYLAYLNRSEVDALGGVFGGLVRWFVQRRLRAEAATVLRGLRQRLESGEPPALAK
jgi:hypothetical protein